MDVHRPLCSEYEPEPTFDLLRDREPMGLLSPHMETLDSDGCGLVTFEEEELEEALKEAKQPETKRILRKMLEEAEREGYVDYYCF